MALCAQIVITSSFVFFIPGILCLRYGSSSQTLHIPEAREEQYYGNGFQIIVNDESMETLHVSSRVKRHVAEASDSSNIAQTVGLNDSHYQMIVHWAGEGSDVILALTKDIHPDENSTSNVYVSRDYGASFQVVDYLENVTVHKYYNSPISNGFYVFTDIMANKICTTSDFAQTFDQFYVSFVPRQLSLHPSDVSVILAYDEEDVDKRLWLSKNFGQTWEVIQQDVKSFFWGNATSDMRHTLYVQRHDRFSQSGYVIRSDDFFKTSHVMAADVVDFQLVKDYMFASRKRGGEHLELWVSYKRGNFVKADFPYNDTHQDYYVADAEEGQVFLCVYHNSSSTHLYISDITGRHFSLSLKNVVYFNPKFRNESLISILRDKPFADVYRIDGLQGFYIASQFQTNSFSLSNQTSFISYDKGSTWEYLQAPSVDAYGNSTHCYHFQHYWYYMGEYDTSCSLHLAQNFHLYHPYARTTPILSKKSAVGMVMATGSLGDSIGGDMNVYVSHDGGVEWREALKGTHFYGFGDYGGVLVAVQQMTFTGEIYYSVDEGETWETVQFSSEKVLVYGLLSEPGETTTIFSLFASYTHRHEWLIIKIDLKSALHGRQCVEDDYKDWTPSESYKVDCMLGQKVTYKRRRAHAICFNGGDWEREISVLNCTCTQEDYECDEGFKKMYVWSHTCVRDPESTIDINAVPVHCPEGTYYNRTKGYRRIAGDTCHGGVESRLEPDRVLCPIREQAEFMLYTTRHAILKHSFTNDVDETLPLRDLHDVVALEFDYLQNCLYWADMWLNSIQKVCLFNNSTRQQITILNDKIGTVESLALDWMSNILYWVDSDSATIEMARTDGSHRRLLIDNSTKLADGSLLHIEKPRSLVLYPKYGIMFWSDWSSNPSITTSNMDGSNIRTLVNSRHVTWPNGLAIDDVHDRLYWTDSSRHGIYSVDLHGWGVQTLIENQLWLPHPYAIAIYKNDIYWTDWSRQAIMMTGLQTDGHAHYFIHNVSSIMDMKIMHFASQIGAGQGPCSHNNGHCNSICVERPYNSTSYLPLNRTCLCSDVFQKVLDSDGKEVCECKPGESLDHVNMTCRPANGSTTCTSDQFLCQSGKCIPKTWRCDRDHDCGNNDMSDELDCAYETCASGMFTCDNNRCIPAAWRCDHDQDCGEDDSSDEPSDCEYHACESTEFRCNNTRCVSLGWLCDGDDDCHDGSDENLTNCEIYGNQTAWHSSNTTCDGTHFTCRNGNCISRSWLCDGADDCGDNSDELDCDTTTGTVDTSCSAMWQYQCSTGECIQTSWICDGEEDCRHGEDEDSCSTTRPYTTISTGTRCNGFYTFDCGNSICVTMTEVCDGVNDCGNGADEDVCHITTTWSPHTITRYTTPYWYTTSTPPDCHRNNDFQCDGGDCIYSAWVCDGYEDCQSGDDELNCNVTSQCPPAYFHCLRVTGCVPSSFVCDGEFDCADHSDENGCENTTVTPNKCRGNDFACDGICIESYRVCDGHIDCMNRADESHCDQKYRIDDFSLIIINSSCWSVNWGHIHPAPPNKSSIQIMYRLVGSPLWINKTQSLVHNYGGNTLLGNLDAGSVYEVTLAVVVHNNVTNLMPYKQITTETTAPGAPDDLKLSVGKDNKGRPILTVKWMQPEEPNGIIQHYYVYAKQQYGTPIRHIVEVSSGPKPTYYTTTYDKFFEDSIVSVWVEANNGLEGKSSEIKRIVIAVPGMPHCTNALKNNPRISYTKQARFTWKYNGNYTIDKIDSFRLIFIPNDTLNINITKVFKLKDLTIGDDATFTGFLDGWSPGLMYLGYVQAHNESGYGHTCFDNDIIINIEGPPIASPVITGDIIQHPLTHELTINLSPPDKPSWYNHTWNPVMMLFYSENEKSLYMTKEKAEIHSVKVPTTNVVHLNGLLSCNPYTFRAQVISPLVSKLGAIRGILTEKDVNSAPTGLTVTQMNMTDRTADILVRFSAPCEVKLPRVYVISVTEVWPNNNTAGVHHSFSVESSEIHVSHIVNDMHRGAHYNISVAVDGDSTRDSRVVSLKIHPHQSPSHFNLIADMENGMVFAEWTPPKIIPKTNNFTYGIYHAVGSDTHFELLAQVRKDEHRFIIMTLEPAKTHKFKVRMDNVYGYSGEFSLVETFTTPSREKWRSYLPATSASPGDNHVTLLSATIVPAVVVVLVLVVALTVYVLRHKRLQRSFLSYANSHYDTRSGTARFSTSDDLDEEDQPMIQGFSDDEPLIVA